MELAAAPLDRQRLRTVTLALGVSLVIVLWAYWTTLVEIARIWSSEPQYSHGYLVPLFALGLLWLRRGALASGEIRPNWWGVAFLAGAVLLRGFGTVCYYVWFDRISLLPCLAGLCLLSGGWTALRWAWPAIAFLAFMVPLPFRLEVAMGGPLQLLATAASTFALQTLGYPALSEGTVILIDDFRIGIVEACSGLRMLVIFFALSTAVALLIRKPLWEKLLILASAIPIALVVNIIRIVATGILYVGVSGEAARTISHDLAGWLMMPLALVFLGLELTALKHLLIEPAPQVAGLGLGTTGTLSATIPTRRVRRRASQPAPFSGKH